MTTGPGDGIGIAGTAARARSLLGRLADGGESNARGIVLLCLGALTFSVTDGIVKHLTVTYNPGLIVWARFTGNLLVVAAVLGPGLRGALRSAVPHIQIWRAIAHVASAALFFSALKYIGLAEMTAIGEINPLFITLGAALFLGERLSMRRLVGVTVALGGALVIIRPGSGVLNTGAILSLIGAFTYAASAILTRLARRDSIRTSVLWAAMVPSGIMTLALPFFWQPVALGDLPALVLLGVLGAVAQILIIRAFAVAEASVIAPFGYSGLIWAGLWGWLFWGAIPDRWTLLGAALIVGAGLYVWAHEARLART